MAALSSLCSGARRFYDCRSSRAGPSEVEGPSWAWWRSEGDRAVWLCHILSCSLWSPEPGLPPAAPLPGPFQRESPLDSPSSPALTFPTSTGQGAAHAVRVGALPRPGRAQPLRSLAASGHLRLQYGAGPLSVVAMTGGSWAGSAHSGHPEDWCLPTAVRPLGTGLLVLYQGDWKQLDGEGLAAAEGFSPHCGPTLLLCPVGLLGEVTAVHRPDGAKGPLPRDSLEAGRQGPGPCHSEWPTGHFSQAILALFFNSALITLYICLIFGHNKRPKCRKAAWVV